MAENGEDSVATIIHPPADSPVAPLDTLIIVELDPDYTGEDFFYLLDLDDVEVTPRWDPDALTLSYFPPRMLMPGTHTLKVYLSVVGGVSGQLVAERTFSVQGFSAPAETQSTDMFNLGSQTEQTHPTYQSPVISPQTTQDTFRLTGRVTLNSQFTDIEGVGAEYRQEPDNTTVLDVNGRGYDENGIYSLRLYMTTDETQFQQPRNRYLFGLESDNFGLSIGDNTPRYNEHTVYGLRLRGMSGWGSLGAITVHLAQGQARRGTSTRYNLDGGIMSRGLGERELWTARAVLWEGEPFELGLTYLDGSESGSDDPLVGDPGDNEVRSLDFLWRFDPQNYGTLRGSWTESDFNYDDPAETDVDGAEAGLLEATYSPFDGHTFVGRYELIEPGFISLGRSNTQQDRESWKIEDRLNIDRGKITGRLFYETFSNNVNGQLTNTTTTDRIGGMIRYRLARTGPTFTVGYSTQDRSNDVLMGEAGRIDDSMSIFNLGLGHTFDFWNGIHTAQIDWRQTSRDSSVSPISDTESDMITFRLISRWRNGFMLNLQYGNTQNDYPGREQSSEIDRISGTLSYTPSDTGYTLYTRYEMMDSSGDASSFNSERETVELGMKWQLGQDMSLEASLMLVDFDDQSDNARDFEEHTFRIILIHLLN